MDPHKFRCDKKSMFSPACAVKNGRKAHALNRRQRPMTADQVLIVENKQRQNPIWRAAATKLGHPVQIRSFAKQHLR